MHLDVEDDSTAILRSKCIIIIFTIIMFIIIITILV